MIAAAWGLLLGIGFVLVASPWLWPRADEPASRRRRGPFVRVGELLHQAGLARVSAATVVIVAVALATAVTALMLALVPVVALAVAVGLAVAALPFAAIAARARARRRAMRAVWPDAVDHLVAGLRSGQALPDALVALGESGPMPLRAAFVSFASDLAATGQLVFALDALKHRLADPVADRVIETLRVAREVGGTELPTVLRALAAHLRSDAALRSEVEARQSWVVSAARLGVAAPWLVLLLLAARPEAVRAYNSPAGVTLLVVGFAITVLAYRIMIAVGRLPEERRWFA
ncbi:MAG: type II secretion system F family protein [Protaetiibacter sp.]